MTKTDTIIHLAQEVADSLLDMFRKKGLGEGNNFTNHYTALVNPKVGNILGKPYVQQYTSGDTEQSVDFFIPEEQTIVKVELSLSNVHTNLDKDIFKALLAIDSGHQVPNASLDWQSTSQTEAHATRINSPYQLGEETPQPDRCH